MELMLEIISRQKFSATFKASKVFGKVGGYIGRGEECEWRIPDKERLISRKHALISCDGKAFYLEDLSSNGIYSLLDKRRIGKKQAHKIEHGESFTIGAYTVQARLLYNPEAYIQGEGGDENSDLIPTDAMLDLDPLVAMEQQDEHEAKRRLGLYNNLLGESELKKEAQLSDHSASRIDSMFNINAIPEDWHAPSAATSPIVPLEVELPLEAERALGAGLPLEQTGAVKHTLLYNSAPTISPALPSNRSEHLNSPMREAPLLPTPVVEYIKMPETETFFKTLGYPSAPESQEEREKILRKAAELLLASVDGMVQSLQNRAESKNDLRLNMTTMRLANNNPLKFCPNAKAALELLLEDQEGMLPAAKAMYAGFDDLHGHHMGLLAGARAAVRASLGKVAPRAVETRLDLNGPVHFKRSSRLWSTYLQMHQGLIDDHEGFAALFLQDFSRAYEVQVRTLHPLADNVLKGEK